jgi:hypothetical protein
MSRRSSEEDDGVQKIKMIRLTAATVTAYERPLTKRERLAASKVWLIVQTTFLTIVLGGMAVGVAMWALHNPAARSKDAGVLINLAWDHWWFQPLVFLGILALFLWQCFSEVLNNPPPTIDDIRRQNAEAISKAAQ